MVDATQEDRRLREAGDTDPWTVDDVLRILGDVLPKVRRAIEAVRATEGEDPQMAQMLHERVRDLASSLWDINGTNLGHTAELDRFWQASYMTRPPFHRGIMEPTLFFLEGVQAATENLRTDGSRWEQTCHSVQEVVQALETWVEDAREHGQGEGEGTVATVSTTEDDTAQSREESSGQNDHSPERTADSVPVILHVPSGEHVRAKVVTAGDMIPPRLEVDDVPGWGTTRYGPADYTRFGYAPHMMLSPAVEDLSPGQRNLLARWTDVCAKIRREDQREAPDAAEGDPQAVGTSA